MQHQCTSTFKTFRDIGGHTNEQFLQIRPPAFYDLGFELLRSCGKIDMHIGLRWGRSVRKSIAKAYRNKINLWHSPNGGHIIHSLEHLLQKAFHLETIVNYHKNIELKSKQYLTYLTGVCHRD